MLIASIVALQLVAGTRRQHLDQGLSSLAAELRSARSRAASRKLRPGVKPELAVPDDRGPATGRRAF